MTHFKDIPNGAFFTDGDNIYIKLYDNNFPKEWNQNLQCHLKEGNQIRTPRDVNAYSITDCRYNHFRDYWNKFTLIPELNSVFLKGFVK